MLTDPLLRVIDVNSNRSREAIRVMEDVARFVLDDAELARGLKTLRHDFAVAIESFASAIVVRDTPNDVGTAISTDTEHERADVRSVARAAGKRLTEALRSLEECVKTVDRSAAVVLESLRYRAYELERRLVLALGSPKGVQWRLGVLLTESLCTHHSWQRVAELALDGGAECLQVREKELTDRELLERARWLREVTHERGASLVINDRPDITVLADADGVHLGQTDMSVTDARRIVGLDRVIGVSATTLEQAVAAAHAGADGLGLGPMFETRTKATPGGRTDGSVAGLALIHAVRRHGAPLADLPHLAIGGITPANARELGAAGIRGLAVSAAVCNSPTPSEVCAQLLQSLPSPDPSPSAPPASEPTHA
ncbi:MAG: thiamine phosphate synthase [Planctomycetota bacterium]